jgi:predicted RNA binding protein YcfA (HicA-like mRNA interferase family)
MALTARDCSEIRSTLKGKATNCDYQTVTWWLAKAGFEPPAKPEGSHRVWVHPSGRRVPLVDKGHGTLLPVYVKKAIKAILETGACPE